MGMGVREGPGLGPDLDRRERVWVRRSDGRSPLAVETQAHKGGSLFVGRRKPTVDSS